MKLLPKVSLTLSLATAAITASAVPITSPGFFGATDTLINFDVFPGAQGVPASGTVLNSQYQQRGVIFSSEDVVNALQTTDPGDTAGRFGAGMLIFPTLSGGGAAISSPRYATGRFYSGLATSDMRFDFAAPVAAFGLWVIDNDFSAVRLQAFTASGNLIESAAVPQVGEGGATFRGIDVTTSGQRISYVILDGSNGTQLDSTFIDNLYYRISPIPEPASGLLILSGLFILRKLTTKAQASR
jgi:hypothetical protein